MNINALKEGTDNQVRRIPYGKSYAEMMKYVNKDEILVALANNGRWDLAPHLFDEDEFNEFHTQYCEGHMLSWIMYAVDKAYFEANKN
jgi:hypothetical protein